MMSAACRRDHDLNKYFDMERNGGSSSPRRRRGGGGGVAVSDGTTLNNHHHRIRISRRRVSIRRLKWSRFSRFFHTLHRHQLRLWGRRHLMLKSNRLGALITAIIARLTNLISTTTVAATTNRTNKNHHYRSSTSTTPATTATGKKRNGSGGGGGSNCRLKSLGRTNSFYAEAIADCIDFIKRSSSATSSSRSLSSLLASSVDTDSSSSSGSIDYDVDDLYYDLKISTGYEDK